MSNSNKVVVKKVANYKMKLPPIKKNEDAVVVGYDVQRDPYANNLIIARKKSGKTTLVCNMALATMGNTTSFFVVSNTVNSDPNYAWLKKKVEQRGNKFYGFNGLFTDSKQNVLENLLAYFKKMDKLHGGGASRLDADDEAGYVDDQGDVSDDEEEEESKTIPSKHNSVFRMLEESEANVDTSEDRMGGKTRYLYPKFIIILDDLPRLQIRNSSVSTLLKQNRHYLCKTFLSSQYPQDLNPECYTNSDTIILFKGLSEKQLLNIKKNIALEDVGDEQFIHIYRNATSEPFTPLIIDRTPDTRLRCGFNVEYSFLKTQEE